MNPGVQAAIRLLPRHKKEVQELALASEDFRGLCSDLAEAELALQRHARSTLPDSAARCAEYRILIDGLEAELRQAVQQERNRFAQGGRT